MNVTFSGMNVVRNRELRRARIVTGQDAAATPVSRERGMLGQFCSCTGASFFVSLLFKFLAQHGHRVVLALC